MSLHLFNTMSGAKEEFRPLLPDSVTMYVCGPTVYDHAHLGHAKTYVAFDVISRYLRYKGYRVRYVQNITDVGHLLLGHALLLPAFGAVAALLAGVIASQDFTATLDGDESLRCVVLRGAGDQAFCAGSNVAEFGEHRTGSKAESYAAVEHDAFASIADLSARESFFTAATIPRGRAIRRVRPKLAASNGRPSRSSSSM